jgi:ribosomal protein L11 methyltransferase
MAFGTGHHETTRSCLQLIVKYFKAGGRFLDFGCGSGLLAILAAKMGASFVKGIDFDPAAIENAQENFEINKISASHALVHGTFEQLSNDELYDVVCANLTSGDILRGGNNLRQLTKKGGVLILSGILETEETKIENLFEGAGMALVEMIHANEWLTFAFRK